jgi:NifU-like protein involved in Fe-S cluster formation
MELGIYNAAMLRLAAEAAGAGRLPAPDGSAEVINPVCGDRITVDIALQDGRIARLGYEVRACVLTQASASLLGRHAPGRTAAEIAALAAAIEAMLEDAGAAPGGEFAGYAALAPVRAHKSRHSCVMLPLRALRAALAAGGGTDPGS